jgi:hypothetical protein
VDGHETGEGPHRAGPSRVPAKGGTTAECMVALARSFPTLAQQADGLDPFDPEKLDRWACGPVPSSGALHAARFVLGVFNPRARWQCGRFDALAAIGTWDQAHRAAFVSWVASPWFA